MYKKCTMIKSTQIGCFLHSLIHDHVYLMQYSTDIEYTVANYGISIATTCYHMYGMHNLELTR